LQLEERNPPVFFGGAEESRERKKKKCDHSAPGHSGKNTQGTEKREDKKPAGRKKTAHIDSRLAFQQRECGGIKNQKNLPPPEKRTKII